MALGGQEQTAIQNLVMVGRSTTSDSSLYHSQTANGKNEYLQKSNEV